MNRTHTLIAGSAILLGLGAGANAGVSTGSMAQLDLLDDAQVRDGIHQDYNMGADDLRSKWDEADYNRHIYLKFDVGGASYDDYQLTLTTTRGRVNATPTTFNVYALNTGLGGFNWDESVITWNNAPGNVQNLFGGPPAMGGGLDMAMTSHVGSFQAPAAWATGDTFDAFLSDLDSFKQLDGTVTLIITSQEMVSDHLPNVHVPNWASKENNDFTGPQLFGNPVPAPGALALLGLAGLASRRRRRS